MEKKRKELGFDLVGIANGTPIFVSTERANASESKKRVLKAKLALATYAILLSGLSSDSELRGKFNDNGKSDSSTWIAGTGSDTNHLVRDSRETEITEVQEMEIFKLAESGMNYMDIAKKLGIPAVGVYYALKMGPKGKKRTKSRRTSVLCTFDKKGSLIIGNGESMETTVRVSEGSDDGPLLFFVLRDSYSRVGGARFVIAACNGRQFGPDTLARVIVGVPKAAQA